MAPWVLIRCIKSIEEGVRVIKRCKVCEEDLDIDFFYKQENGLYGLQSRCKICEKKRNQIKYQKNKERYIQVQKDYQQKIKQETR